MEEVTQVPVESVEQLAARLREIDERIVNLTNDFDHAVQALQRELQDTRRLYLRQSGDQEPRFLVTGQVADVAHPSAWAGLVNAVRGALQVREERRRGEANRDAHAEAVALAEREAAEREARARGIVGSPVRRVFG